MFADNPKLRGWVYVLMAIAAFALAIVVIFFGHLGITEEQVFRLAELTVLFFASFAGGLAKMHTPKE